MEHEPTITCLNPSNSNSGALQRSINNMINIPRTIIHPTPPHPPPHPALSRSMIQRDQHPTNDNTPHPTPPPHPALSRSMIQRDHLQRSINNVINIPRTIIHPTPPPTPHPTPPCRGAWYNVIICSGATTGVRSSENLGPRGYIYLYIHTYIQYKYITIYIYTPLFIVLNCCWYLPSSLVFRGGFFRAPWGFHGHQHFSILAQANHGDNGHQGGVQVAGGILAAKPQQFLAANMFSQWQMWHPQSVNAINAAARDPFSTSIAGELGVAR